MSYLKLSDLYRNIIDAGEVLNRTGIAGGLLV